MSHYGTTQDYETGYDDGADETAGLYDDLVAAAAGLRDQWPTGGNLSTAVQALTEALARVENCRRFHLETSS